MHQQDGRATTNMLPISRKCDVRIVSAWSYPACLPSYLYIYIHILHFYVYHIYQHFGLVVRVWTFFWLGGFFWGGCLIPPSRPSIKEAEEGFETIQKKIVKGDGGLLLHHLIENNKL
jgi:hypothetical protein